jgi:hypothetical protein
MRRMQHSLVLLPLGFPTLGFTEPRNLSHMHWSDDEALQMPGMLEPYLF